MNNKLILSSVVLLIGGVTLTGCEVAPSGPSVAVMPSVGKPLDLFQQEDQYCRSYAYQSIAPSIPAANTKAVGTAVIGTAVGTAVGALGGGWHGPQHGAAVGLAAGSMIGVGQAENGAYSLQQRYDIAYQQCMYSKGNQIQPPQPSYEYRRPRGYYYYP